MSSDISTTSRSPTHTLVPDFLSADSKIIQISCIVPVYNSMPQLIPCVNALREAAMRHGAMELLFVDNGSTDGSHEFLLQQGVRVLQDPAAGVSKLRNLGAAASSGRVLSFIDSDCVIGPDYFQRLEKAFGDCQCACTGSMVAIPDSPHWIEATWNGLHKRSKPGPVQYLNTGNVAVLRDAFNIVGGFDETLKTGEDAAFGLALRTHGFPIVEDLSLRAIHLGNPKTLREFFRKEIWRGQGALGTVRFDNIDKPFTLTLLHGVFVLSALVLVLALRDWKAVIFACLLIMASPLLAYAYRAAKKRQLFRPVRATFLYLLYLSARVVALLVLAARKPFRS